MRVLYFGAYDRREPADDGDIGRNALLIGGLRRAGATVVECHVPVWTDTSAKLRAAACRQAWPRTLLRVALAWRRLSRLYRRLEPPDVILVGATAPQDLWLARRLARRAEVPLVFDPLISLSETARDRGLWPPGGRLARTVRRAEAGLWRLADLVLVDTPAHGRAFEAELGLSAARRRVVPVGAPEVFRLPPAGDPPGGALRLLYFGQFIPLHGLEYVLEAVGRLTGGPAVELRLVGTGQTLADMRRLAGEMGLANVTFVPQWLAPGRLRDQEIAGADLCLGVFGHQPKTKVVVPYKLYAALAASRPVLTADTPAVRELLHADEEIFVCPAADPAALAESIARLAGAPEERRRVALAGRAAYEARFTPAQIGTLLVDVLRSAIGPRGEENGPVSP